MALTTSEGAASAAPVIALDEPEATDAHVAGAKAANLAKAVSLGLPVLPGFVVTAGAGAALDDALRGELQRAWHRLSGGGRKALVVRSSSAVEDGATGSMAGVFKSILDVRGWDEFLEAFALVIASASTAAAAGLSDAPMAVLVQPQLEAVRGGVMFGADPLTGRTDRILAVAVDGGPEPLVSGRVEGARYLLSPRTGRVVERHGDPEPALGRGERKALVALARLTEHVFGGPQDIEWAFGPDGRLWLLQARPITAMASAGPTTGPVLGPGPVAETFAEPLSVLEADLWLTPLRAALREALLLTGAAPRRRVAASPVVQTVGGWAAADLDLLGVRSGKRSFFARFDPRPPSRRLAAAWRVGRLHTAFPALAADLLSRLDADLRAVPSVRTVADDTLVGMLERGRHALVALHGHEVLAGMLSPSGAASSASGAGAALRSLALARRTGASDDEILARHPEVLALLPPSIGRAVVLPDVEGPLPLNPAPDDPTAAAREDLRLRIRWVQELMGRAALEVGHRLAERGLLADATWVRHLTADELRAAVLDGVAPQEIAAQVEDRPGPPLPAEFRLTIDGAVVALVSDGGDGGHGVSGGRTVGRVHQGDGAPGAGDVLVVRSLEPALAAVLPRLGGLVSETGSALSHLAILARELGIPTVVGVAGAVERFPAGTAVMVDGGTGEVVRLDVEDAA